MTRSEIYHQIQQKRSFLCVGLDTDPSKLPPSLSSDPRGVLRFNKAVIDATRAHCIAYKINLAFYEAMGSRGWDIVGETLAHIPDTHLTIADAKRGDIGNTSHMYAKTFFETFSFDAITVAPYMGFDSVTPFLEFDGKWVIVLALTSNKGSRDFQFIKDGDGVRLYEHVLKTAISWGTPDNLMFVVGATQEASIQQVRQLAPYHFLLVPGVGAQGGSLTQVYRGGRNNEVGLLINSSRSIIYAGGDDPAFETHVRQAAAKLHNEMRTLLDT